MCQQVDLIPSLMYMILYLYNIQIILKRSYGFSSITPIVIYTSPSFCLLSDHIICSYVWLAGLQSPLPRLPFHFINRNASCPWAHRPCAQLKKCTCGHNQFSLMALCVSNNGKWRLNSYWKLSNEKRVIRIVALERGKDCRSVIPWTTCTCFST